MKKLINITVGIPTRYAGNSLLKTVETIFASNITNIRCIIVADNIPVSYSLRKKLEKLGAEVYWNPKPGSQFRKLKQIINKTDTDLFIFTQDDITFRPDTISEIIKTFSKNPSVTMVGSRILPLTPVTLFEKSMTSMVRIIDRVSGKWNKGRNYLTASGRCISFRTKLLKKFIIREQIVNGDMYLYLENKRLGGEIMRAGKSKVYIRCPQSINDQIGPSSRYQFSETELKKYFDFDIKPEYHIPFFVLVRATITELILHPRSALLYFFIFIYTRIKRQPYHTISPIWKIDESTKK